MEDAWYSILAQCQVRELGRCVQVCKLWQKHGDRDTIWAPLVQRDWGAQAIREMEVRELEKEIATRRQLEEVPRPLMGGSAKNMYKEYYQLSLEKMFLVDSLMSRTEAMDFDFPMIKEEVKEEKSCTLF